MNIFFIGGTGFVGKPILYKLLECGYKIKLLTTSKIDIHGKNIELIKGTSSNFQEWEASISGVDLVINLAGIIREYKKSDNTFYNVHVKFVKSLVDALNKYGIERYIHMSANGTENPTTRYLQTKLEGEKIVESSNLHYTIMKPSLIFGSGDQVITLLASKIKELPFIPCFGSGKYMMQPIWVEDMAKIVNNIIFDRETHRSKIELGGPTAIKWIDILNCIAEAVHVNKKVLHFPIGVLRPILGVFDSVRSFPITRDQLTMLLQGNITENNKSEKILKTKSKDIRDIIPTYIK